jgi:hypothetical protein
MSNLNEVFIIHPETSEQISAIKALMKALKIKFEVSVENKSPYRQEFVDKIIQGDKDFKEGKGIKMSLDELKEICK